MGIFYSEEKLHAAQRARFRRVVANMRAAHAHLAGMGRNDFRALTSGSFSGKGRVPRRLPINVRTGRLRGGIQLSGPTGPKREYRLYSDAPHGKYVLSLRGTRTMAPRGLLGPNGRLRKLHQARMPAVVLAWKKVNRSN